MRPRLACASLPLLLTTTLLTGCSNESVPTTTATGVEARFDLGDGNPRYLDVPFPSDAYVDEDGTIADTIPGLDAYVLQNAATLEATLATQRGFGLNAGVHFRLDDLALGVPAVADAGSLPATEEACTASSSSVLLVDLDAAAGEDPLVPCRTAVQDDRESGSTSPPVVAVLPARGVVLREGRRYAAVLTTAVTAGGAAVSPSATFKAIRDGGRLGDRLGDLYGAAIDRAADLVPALADRSHIAALTVFTTQASSQELVDLRALVASMPPSPLSWAPADLEPMHAALFSATATPGYTATLDDWLGAPATLPDGTDDPAGDQQTGAAHDAIAAIGTAVFDAPNALRYSPDGYADPIHATFARDATGALILNPEQPTAKIWITIALPQAPVPPAGFPVVIIQHGLQSDRSFLLTMANTFARQGWASVAIDGVTFGARAESATNTADAISRFPWSDSAAYAGPDGLVDKPADAVAFFGGFLNFGAPRDQLRQNAIDIGSLAELVRDPGLDLGPLLAAVPGAKLDGTRLAYVGDSFGSIVGLMVAAIDPRIQAMVLNVGGGGIITEIASNGPALATLVGTAGGLTLGLSRDRFNWPHPTVNLLQSILDPADPLTHAHRLVQEPVTVDGTPQGRKSIVLVEALWDELVANEGSEALARAAGMPLAAPHVDPNGGVSLSVVEPTAGEIRGAPVEGATVVLVQASPATHGSNLYNAMGKRHYAYPFNQPGPVPFPTLPQDIPVRQPYLGLQAMMVDFFASSFAGEVPVVQGFPAPVRDFDDDGREDASDADPNDPSR